MSTDMVGDLHAAEDRIGLLESTLQSIARALTVPDWSPDTLDQIAHAMGPWRHEDPVTAERLRLNDDTVWELRDLWCRPSCEYHHDDWEREDCGCPCHYFETSENADVQGALGL